MASLTRPASPLALLQEKPSDPGRLLPAHLAEAGTVRLLLQAVVSLLLLALALLIAFLFGSNLWFGAPEKHPDSAAVLVSGLPLLVLFAAYGITSLHNVWRRWHNRRQRLNGAVFAGSRAAPQGSAEICLFSPLHALARMAAQAAQAACCAAAFLLLLNDPDKGEWLYGLLFLLFLIQLQNPSERSRSLLRTLFGVPQKTVYRADTDRFIFYGYTLRGGWQVLAEYPASDFTGIYCQPEQNAPANGNSITLWLAGREGGRDVSAGSTQRWFSDNTAAAENALEALCRASGLPPLAVPPKTDAATKAQAA